MEREVQNKLKEAITDALSMICRKDENGMFYEEIYADYRNELEKQARSADALIIIK